MEFARMRANAAERNQRPSSEATIARDARAGHGSIGLRLKHRHEAIADSQAGIAAYGVQMQLLPVPAHSIAPHPLQN